MDKRINGIVDLVSKSEYKNIIITGCGEEQAMWEEIKIKIKNNE